jgi:hypothetical protein
VPHSGSNWAALNTRSAADPDAARPRRSEYLCEISGSPLPAMRKRELQTALAESPFGTFRLALRFAVASRGSDGLAPEPPAAPYVPWL